MLMAARAVPCDLALHPQSAVHGEPRRGVEGIRYALLRTYRDLIKSANITRKVPSGFPSLLVRVAGGQHIPRGGGSGGWFRVSPCKDMPLP